MPRNAERIWEWPLPSPRASLSPPAQLAWKAADAGIEREHAGRGLGRLLGIAVDGAHLFLGGLRARHGIEQVRALLLQGGQPLGVGLLAEGGARALEGRQHAGGVELGALVVGVGRLGGLDALPAVSASPLSLARSPSMVESSRSIWAMRVSTVASRFCASLVRSCLILYWSCSVPSSAMRWR